MWEVANTETLEVRSETFKTWREAVKFVCNRFGGKSSHCTVVHTEDETYKVRVVNTATAAVHEHVVFNSGDGRAW
jgi:hypothetical protein